MRRRCSVPVPVFFIALMLTASAAFAGEPARVLLERQPTPEGGTRIEATVVDEGGNPVAGASVAFAARMTFGWMRLEEGSTDEKGRAGITLPPPLRPREIVAEAQGETETARASIRLGEARTSEPAARPSRQVLRNLSPQPGAISPYPVPLLAGPLAAILGGIWATYGYVFWLLARIHRSG